MGNSDSYPSEATSTPYVGYGDSVASAAAHLEHALAFFGHDPQLKTINMPRPYSRLLTKQYYVIADGNRVVYVKFEQSPGGVWKAFLPL
jgi:hypothetical protein